MAGVLAGMGVVWASQRPSVWLLCAVISVVAAPPRVERAALQRAGTAILGAVAGYGAVWNANVMAARLVQERLVDGWFRSWDISAYQAMGLARNGYDGLFPLIRVEWLLQALNDAYLLVVPEVFVVIVVVAWRSRALADRLLTTIFGAYAIGLATFVILPAVGPCIAFPGSLDRAALPGQTDVVMRAMADGFRDVTNGANRPVIAYFVALPSLHVLLALVLQWHLRRFRFAGALFAPINGLVIVSTVALGYHYLIDVAGAVALAPAVLAAFDPEFRRAWRRTHGARRWMVQTIPVSASTVDAGTTIESR